jgi:acyl-CoA thioesterase-2
VPDDADGFVELLSLERIEVNIFRGGGHPGTSTRVFGGQVVAQALLAAGRTVPRDRRVHSLHGYFLRPGDSGAPMVFEVDRIREGRSFTTRQVSGIQHGETIFHLTASFHRPEDGPQFQDAAAPATTSPDETPTTAQWFAPFSAHPVRRHFERYLGYRPLEVRFVDEPPPLAVLTGPRPPRQALWIRAIPPLPEDPLLHACAVTYASDMSLVSTGLLPHGLTITSDAIQTASIDHSVWFHRPFRADDWLLYAQDSPSSAGARGFTRGQIFTADGVLIASTAQESLIRQH